MKTIIITLITATVIMTSCGSGANELANELDNLAKEMESNTDEAINDLVEESAPSSLFESEDGKFKINFIGGTPVIQSQSVPTEVGNIEMTTFMYEKSATEVYMVAYNDYPSGILEFSTPEDLLIGGKEGVVEQMGITTFDIEEELNKDGHAGLHFRGTNGTYYVEYEMYLVENRLYQIGILRDGSYPTEERVAEFLGTFEFI